MKTLVFCSIVLFAACSANRGASAPAQNLTLTVEQQTVESGATVDLVLRNASSAPAGYNLCTSSLERRTDVDWEPLSSNRVCTMELSTLQPGAEARYTYDLPSVMIPGQYRFVTSVQNMETDERSSIRSDPFSVER